MIVYKGYIQSNPIVGDSQELGYNPALALRCDALPEPRRSRAGCNATPALASTGVDTSPDARFVIGGELRIRNMNVRNIVTGHAPVRRVTCLQEPVLGRATPLAAYPSLAELRL